MILTVAGGRSWTVSLALLALAAMPACSSSPCTSGLMCTLDQQAGTSACQK